MSRRSGLLSACFAFFCSICSFAQQPQLICDVTCEPNTQYPGYNSIPDTRVTPKNERGSQSAYAPRVSGSDTQPSAGAVVAGSESYNYAIGLLNLPGRNGLDVNLTLYYNSHVWTIDKSGATPKATFNADRDFPSYGFRLGYGYLENSTADGNYILTESDGSKRLMTSNGNGTFDTTDSSYINYSPSQLLLRYKSGLMVL